MTTDPTSTLEPGRFERMYDAPAELIWELWTTRAGLEEWFAPDGFETRVLDLELTPGGRLRYIMTATAPEQVAFMRGLGAPLASELQKTFTEVARPSRLAYLTLVDFVPGVAPYEHLTTVDIDPAAGGRTRVVLTMAPFHDKAWTQGSLAHRREELDNLAVALARRCDR